jgi:competence protein ComEC
VSLFGHAAFALALLSLALVLHGRLRPWRSALVVLTAMLATALVPPAAAAPEVVFLDVGQGDATLLRLPGRVEVLIDGGGSPFGEDDVGARVVLPALRALGVRALDVVVATHADLDHVEGLVSVLQSMPVGTLVTGPPDPQRPIDARLRALARERGIALHRARRGERWLFGGGRWHAELSVLNPGERSAGNANDDSVALLLRYGGTPQALFLGDASSAVEERLALPRVPVLKVAHHGSGRSTGEALLRATGPRAAIVSVGRNGYGHPDPAVLQRLERHGVAVYSTLREGALRVALTPRGPLPPRGTLTTVRAAPL